jgi:diguanylate cyclase (GGDEF)-like protein
VAAIGAIALGWVHPSLGWDTAWTASAFAACWATQRARRSAAPAERRRWTLWFAAMVTWLVSQIIWDAPVLTGYMASPNLADVGWWVCAVLMMLSVAPARTQSRSLRIVAGAETMPLVGAAVALSFAELWPTASSSSLPLIQRISALAYPAVYVSAAVLMLQAMVAGYLRHSRSPALRLILIGMVAQALAFALWSKQLLEQAYVVGHTLLDPLWAIGVLSIALGAALAPRLGDVTERAEDPSHRGVVLPAGVFVLLLAGLAQAELNHGALGAVITLSAGLLLSGGALIVRGMTLERRLQVMLDREREALAKLGEREAQLALMNTQLVEDSRHDALTGMRNRRALADDLRELETHPDRARQTFALALCDIDHFKAYNDRLGHLAGDRALRMIAATIRGALRDGDLAYRFGGEELLLVLQDVAGAQAVAAVERVRLAVESAAIPHPEGIGGVLTVTIGVASGEVDLPRVLARADAALYEGKRSGRNRVVAGSDSDELPPLIRHPVLNEQPVPRHLRSMLAVSRAASSGKGVFGVLEALANTIQAELAYQVVAVNLLDEERQTLSCVLVLGDEDARRALLDTASPWREWDQLMRSEHERCGAIWLPAGSHAWSDRTTIWNPPLVGAPQADSWRPEDMLLLPLRGRSGEVLAVVSVDQPLNGARPDDAELTFLMAVADHAGLALEQAQRDTAQAAALHEQSAELRLAAVMLLAEALDLRDASTANHSQTVGTYARQIAQTLGLQGDRIDRIHAAGVLHDLGKLGIADAILFKPGPLTDDEWREMKTHPVVGARILEHAGLPEIARWVRAHHERIDGAGYPDGLSASSIPVEARILAVADAYEAMIADRPYRGGRPHEDAIQELERCAGTQFDAAVVRAFIASLGEEQRAVPKVA